VVAAYLPNEFGVTLPADAKLSPAFSLAARLLAVKKPAFEFLRETDAHRAVHREIFLGSAADDGGHRGGRGGDIDRIVLFQQIQLWRLRSQWSHMSTKVAELENIQNQIRFYRPWYDDSYRTLSILRQVTLAFPEDGAVTAKTIEIRDSGTTVSCSGNTRDNASLRAVLANLSKAEGVSGLKLDQLRGKAPMQFTFDFKYGNGGAQ